MAVKIRLMRLGKKKQPVYRMVVIDSRKARNGRYIEALGRYEPRQDPSLVEVDNEKAVEWLKKGAQPTDRAKKVLEISGAWSLFKIARGEIHTVAAKPAPVVDEVAETTPEPPIAESEAVAAPVEAVVADAGAEEVVEDVTEDVPEDVTGAAEAVTEAVKAVDAPAGTTDDDDTSEEE